MTRNKTATVNRTENIGLGGDAAGPNEVLFVYPGPPGGPSNLNGAQVLLECDVTAREPAFYTVQEGTPVLLIKARSAAACLPPPTPPPPPATCPGIPSINFFCGICGGGVLGVCVDAAPQYCCGNTDPALGPVNSCTDCKQGAILCDARTVCT